MNRQFGLAAATALIGVSTASCGADRNNDAREQTGDAEVALTNAPADVACLRVTVAGASRTLVESFALAAGEKAVFALKGLPVGNATFSADAFNVACNQLIGGTAPTWYSEPVVAAIKTAQMAHVALKMIHNGRASVGVDFDDAHGPSEKTPTAPIAGVATKAQAYVIPSLPGIVTKAIFTAGDSANTKPDGSLYRMVGIPDGLGAFDNGDGTFSLLSNQELGVTNGIERAHGAAGAFVSQWKIRKVDLAVLEGKDLINKVVLWNPAASSYGAPVSGVAFNRFCSGDLPARTALFDAATGLGFDGDMMFNGEESGDEGRGFAHGIDGVSYELPRAGKFSWENNVLNPGTGVKTVLAGTDDSGGGQLYFYVGTKTNTGTSVEKAGLTNGVLYGLKVSGYPSEDAASGIPSGTAFSAHKFGNVENWSGAELQTQSATNGVTGFMRPEDAAWDPNNSNHLYFVTTASFTSASRLWRAKFKNASQPELGGTIDLLLDGSEGQKMLDNLTLDHYGHVYLQEDVGGNNHIGKILRYDVATDVLVEIAKHNPTLFDPSLSSPTFITNDEESSGIIDASNILGPGWFLLDVQAHKNLDAELVQDGQFLALFDPAASGK